MEPSVERMLEPGAARHADARAVRVAESRDVDASRHAAAVPRVTPMMLVTFDAIVPMVVRDRRGALPRWSPRRSARRASGCRSAPLGVIGLVGAAVATRAALGPQRRRASASSSADNFGLFVDLAC